MKDERYFEAFKRNILVTATTHGCEEVLYGTFTNSRDDQELFQQKKDIMYGVFNKVLQRDMGKTIVRKHALTLDAQSVWRESASHMSTSSKGLNERHRLHAYVLTTAYDRSRKGTNEKFVLHFHEQLRQLDEVTPLENTYLTLSD